MPDGWDADQPPPRLSPQALSPEDVARVLAAVSPRPVTAAMVQADLAAGAPTNADGTVNLVHYAAWLLREGPRAT